MRAKPVARNSLVESMAQELRNMVTKGEIQPGEFFPPQKELAARFGVGLSTIHEAMQVLATLGMVASQAGKGTWVRPEALQTLIHPTTVRARLADLDAHQVLETRTVIEVALTELAAQRANAEDIQRIKDALRRLEAALGNEDAFAEADLAFHTAVAEAGHNDLLAQFYHTASRLLSEFILHLVRLPRASEESLRLETAIAEAIEQRDAVRARRLARWHVRQIGQMLSSSEQAEPALTTDMAQA